VADTAVLAEDLATERSRAIRALLRTPLLDVAADTDTFRIVARHSAWLTEWFETACGWSLLVDTAAGFARLGKRAARPDTSRPLRRTRGSSQPFDRRRYQLLCLVCAELVRHPVTTVGLLARAVSGEAALDTSRHAERSAFVDALLVLDGWGALRVTAGDLETFLHDDRSNALLTADTARLHRLLVSATAPSALPEGIETEAAVERLLAEPRYGEAPRDPDAADREQRMRWLRHTLARRLLDDPVVHLDDLSREELDYLAASAGRRWLREQVGLAGLELEERAEGLLAVDPDALATDVVFPAPVGNVHQLALLLIDALTEADPGGSGARRVGALSPATLRRAVDDVMRRFPHWARSHRHDDGPERLAQAAVDLLAGFGLVRREPDGTVVGRPALARYRSGEPATTTTSTTTGDADQANLFEEAP
jgi:uncharacterized protein (TIGR02678 family)